MGRTSSVETWMKRLRPDQFLAASMSTCEPITLFSVKANELPKELSTCVCRGECRVDRVLWSVPECRVGKASQENSL